MDIHRIPLTQGKFALVDKEDFEWLNQYKWYFDGNHAVRHDSIENDPKRTLLRMHRIVMGVKGNFVVTHKNNDRLDNRKRNLITYTKEEYKQLISKKRRGIHFCPEAEFKKGHKHSKSVLKKVSKTWIKKGQRIGLKTEFKKGNIPWSKGKKFMSDEFYKKLSLSGLKKQMNMNEPTSIEKKVYEELKNRGLLFEKQKIINGKFIVDAYIPSLNLVIEADGDYWHSLDNIRKRDKSKNAYFKKCGFNLLRLTETEINNDNFKSKLDKIEGGKYG